MGPRTALLLGLAAAACAQDIDVDPRMTVYRDGGVAGDGGSTSDGGSKPPCTLAPKSAGIRLARSSDGSLTSGVATASGRIAFVWEDVARRSVSFAVINSDGSIRNPARVLRSEGFSPAITAAEGDFAVVLHRLDLGDLEFIRLDRDGTEILSVPLAQNVSSMAGYPKIAYRPDRFGVAYYEGSDATGFEVRFARLHFDGIRIEEFHRLAGTSMTTALVDLTATDDGYAAVWIDERDGPLKIFAARIGDDGVKRMPPGDIALTQGGRQTLFPTIASRGGGDLQVCYDITSPNGQSDKIECVHLAADNTVGPIVPILDSDDTASLPKTIWTGSHYFVGWADQAPGIGQIFGRHLGLDGMPATPIQRMTEISGTTGYPALAFADGVLIAGWYQFFAATDWEYDFGLFACP